ncbi:hypothetical protein CC79DRAFT_454700 [Sarocladium strictum]
MLSGPDSASQSAEAQSESADHAINQQAIPNEDSEPDVVAETAEERKAGQIYDPKVEYFVNLADGTDFNLGHEPWKATVAEVQEKLKSLGKPTLSDDKISELRENGWLKEE